MDAKSLKRAFLSHAEKKKLSKALVNLNFHFQRVLRFVIAVWWKSFQLCGSKRTLCSSKMLEMFSKNRNWQKKMHRFQKGAAHCSHLLELQSHMKSQTNNQL